MEAISKLSTASLEEKEAQLIILSKEMISAGKDKVGTVLSYMNVHLIHQEFHTDGSLLRKFVRRSTFQAKNMIA